VDATHRGRRAEPFGVRAAPVGPVAGFVCPVRELRVIVRIDGQQAAASQLTGNSRLPRSGVTRDEEGPAYARGDLLEHGDLALAGRGDRGLVPPGPAVLEAGTVDPGHQVKLGWPDVTIGSGMPDQAAADLHPVVRPRDLPDQVVERLDPDVVRVEAEDPGRLAGGNTAELRHDQLQHEAGTRVVVMLPTMTGTTLAPGLACSRSAAVLPLVLRARNSTEGRPHGGLRPGDSYLGRARRAAVL
jgi:hypothetical protein